MKIRVETLSNPGGREHNEDYCGFVGGDGRYALALADGLGGHCGGEIASETAVEVALMHLADSGNIADAFDAAQSAVREVQHQNPRVASMRTTLVLAAIDGDEVRFGHVGDSRLYIFSKGRVTCQTSDHSVVNVLCKTGEIKEKQMRSHPDRNKLLRVVGEPGAFRPAIAGDAVRLVSGDAVLICTDGFWEYVWEKEMVRALKKAEEPAQWLRLMEKTLLRRAKKGHDNYSAIAVMATEANQMGVSKRQ